MPTDIITRPGFKLLTIILGVSSLWNGFTLLFGAIALFNKEVIVPTYLCLIVPIFFLLILLNTPVILAYSYDITGLLLKVLWTLVIVYNCIISYYGNVLILIDNHIPNENQKFILIGITFFVSASPILFSLMIPEVEFIYQIPQDPKLLFTIIKSTFVIILKLIKFLLFIALTSISFIVLTVLALILFYVIKVN